MPTFILLVILILLSSCATSGKSLPQISERETDAFLKEFNSETEEQAATWTDLESTTTGNHIPQTYEWVQPANKDVDCLMYFSSHSEHKWWRDPDANLYWDGQCENGFAYGVGREFADISTGLRSSLAKYQSSGKPPTYYLSVFYDEKRITFHSRMSEYAGTLSYWIESPAVGSMVMASSTLLDTNERRVYSTHWSYGGDVVTRTIHFPNGRKFSRLENSNPTQNGVEWNTYAADYSLIGFSVGNYKNNFGSKITHLKHAFGTAPLEVSLPTSYLEMMSAADKDINRSKENFSRVMAPVFVAISEYKRRICGEGKALDQVARDIYFRICEDEGEVAAYQPIINARLTEQKDRFKEQDENQKRQVAAMNRIQAQERESAQQLAAQNSLEAAALMRQLNATAQSFRQGAEQLQRSTSQYRMPEVNFGRQKQSTTNCIQISSTNTHCRTKY